MIEETSGNLLEANAEALVNAVNCVGVIGKGLALQFKQRFPVDYFKNYKIACQNGELTIGKVQIYELKNAQANPYYIINFPTKGHWREKSRIEDIESGLSNLVEAIEKYEIKSVAIPALGCGLGGLNWEDVKPLIENTFAQIPNVQVFLYPPA